jgi:hypothetical protein
MKAGTVSRDLNDKERSRRGSYQICFRSSEHFKGKCKPVECTAGILVGCGDLITGRRVVEGRGCAENRNGAQYSIT